MVAWSQPACGAQAGIMELKELTARLHRNKTVTSAMVDAIEYYASALSRDIYDDYNMLNSIMVRHEGLIRLRWTKKTIAQRRKVLLAAWPNMPIEHRPDVSGATLQEQAILDLLPRDGTLPDFWVWPFINQEDLLTSKTLLVYMNTRGRKTPWEFAAIETQFSPFLIMNTCSDKKFCGTVTMDFTKTLDPSIYGRLNRRTDCTSKHCDREDKYDICARRGFQVLLVQQRILAFLLTCARAILHDLTEDVLLNGHVQEAPPIAQILVDKHVEHTSFTDVLNIAPYRGWDSLNFSQLHGYIQGTFTTQKDHIWALREDPGYFADTVQEYLDHSVYAIPMSCSNEPHPYILSPRYKASILEDMLDESYGMVSGWSELNKRLDKFDALLRDGASKQQQAQAILKFKLVARDIGSWLLKRVFRYSRAAPGCRTLLRQKCGTAVWEHKYEYASGITAAEKKVLELFAKFRPEKKDSLLDWPIFLALQLEKVERLLQTSATARKTITSRLLSLLTDLSIITECLRQASLWGRSPDVKTGKVDACSCKVTLDDEVLDFGTWHSSLHDGFSPPLGLVFPLRGKLNYPEHKKRARDTVATMRKAEQNLDHFWSAIDAHYEGKTGVAQHQTIRECLQGNGEMNRTVPWENTPVSQVKEAKPSSQEYHPIPATLHDKALQITGAFDKMAFETKTKPKTRGVADSNFGIMGDLAVQPPDIATTSTNHTFTVDKRTYNVFRTLLSAPSDGVGEVSKSAKWAEFKRAMVRIGFSAEKLQGSAWQFTPEPDIGTGRSIQFHEPHPDSEITYVIAKRMGRRLGRVYGWRGDTFTLA